MNEMHEHQLICIATFDRAFGACEDGLDVVVIPVGPDAWPGLLEAAKLQESDDEECCGFFVRAHAIDLITDRFLDGQCWDDLCYDQVARIHLYLEESHVSVARSSRDR